MVESGMGGLPGGFQEARAPGRAFHKRLRPRRRADKARTTVSETAMAGIYLIIAFIAVIAILNRVEFGRFD
ncbi:hypothetical protein [Phenylobacterium sp.]|jgi:hypothetical protein|uniref:hypothetical protein n=1 Tax=Phenylobacterium sp. TaxID=1871053 RepID=UPI002F404135